jgi:Phage derived protein Gp49-like (DUF891)
MPLRILQSGSKFNVCVWEEIGLGGVAIPSPVPAWLRTLDARHRGAFDNLIRRHADHGRIKNEQKSRELGDGVFEFKSHYGRGERLAYFYLPGGRTVLSHGFPKGANVQAQIARGQALRARIVESEK